MFDFEAYRNLPTGYGIAIPDRVRKALASFLDVLTEGSSEEERESLGRRMGQALSDLGPNVMDGVNTERRANETYDEPKRAAWSKFVGKNAIHLELGTWTAFPDERINAAVAGDNLGDFIRLDFNAEFKPDVAASVTSLPFADNSIDRIHSNSLLEHVAYPHEVMAECFRVLRPGGAMFHVVPFHFVEHGCPSDYFRITDDFFRDICAELGFAQVVTDNIATSGVYYTIHQLAKAALAQDDKTLTRDAHIATVALLAGFTGLDDDFRGGGAAHWHSTAMFAVKDGEYTEGPPIDRTIPFVDRHLDKLICPRTGKPLKRVGDVLVAGKNRYPIKDGVPELVEMHGPNSPARLRAEIAKLRAAKA